MLNPLWLAIQNYLNACDSSETMNCTKLEFDVIIRAFNSKGITSAFQALKDNEWESNELLISLEGGVNGYAWNNGLSLQVTLNTYEASEVLYLQHKHKIKTLLWQTDDYDYIEIKDNNLILWEFTDDRQSLVLRDIINKESKQTL